jgi:hypothetical protein
MNRAGDDAKHSFEEERRMIPAGDDAVDDSGEAGSEERRP